MTYEPKFWVPDEVLLENLIEQVRDIMNDAVEEAFKPLEDTLVKTIDKNVQEAVEYHVKEGLLWIVYNEGEPCVEFTAFLGDAGEGEPQWPERSESLREIFQGALDNLDEEEPYGSLWKALIKTYDEWKAS